MREKKAAKCDTRPRMRWPTSVKTIDVVVLQAIARVKIAQFPVWRQDADKSVGYGSDGTITFLSWITRYGNVGVSQAKLIWYFHPAFI